MTFCRASCIICESAVSLQRMEKSRSWPSAHDWKSCIPQKGIEGSNPSFSAKPKTPRASKGFGFSLRLFPFGILYWGFLAEPIVLLLKQEILNFTLLSAEVEIFVNIFETQTTPQPVRRGLFVVRIWQSRRLGQLIWQNSVFF